MLKEADHGLMVSSPMTRLSGIKGLLYVQGTHPTCPLVRTFLSSGKSANDSCILGLFYPSLSPSCYLKVREHCEA